MSGESVVLGIKLTIDGKEVSGEIRAQTAELQKLGQTAQTSNQQARSSADQYAASLRKQAETLGMTRTQTMAYEASQHQLTAAQREQVAANIKAIEAHERHEKILGRVRIAATAAGAALAAGLIAGLRASIASATEAEQAELRLQAVVSATGRIAGLTAQELIQMAGATQDRLGINDEAVKGSMAVLLTFRSVSRESFGEALEVAANLAKVMGTDLQSATLQLGKALEEPEQGLVALRRSGVSFNETQKQMIKDLVETGNQAQAITTILQIMKDQGLDKVAESMNQGLFRATNTLKNEWDDFLEAIGRTPTVKGPVEGTFGLISQRLRELKDLIELPVWERLKVIGSFGLYKPKIGTANMVPDINNMDAVADAGAKKIRDAQDAYSSFMKNFRSDNEKLADELRKLKALYDAGGMSIEQYIAAQGKIRAKLAKEPQKSDYDQIIKAIHEKSAVQQAELEGQSKLTEADQVAMKAMVGLRDGTLKLTEAQKIQLGVELEKMLALDREVQLKAQRDRADKAAVESAELQIRAGEREGEMLASLNESLDERRQEIELETELMGASDAQREKTIELRKLDNQFLKQSADLYGEAWEAAHRLYLEERGHISDALDRRGTAKEAQKLIEDTKQTAKKLDEDLQRGLTDSIFRGFEAGKGFAENFRDSLVNMFKTTILRPVIQWIVSPVTGAITASLGSLGVPGLANAAGGGAGGLGSLGSLFSVSNLPGMGNPFGGAGGILGGLSDAANGVFQNLGVSMGSQFLADIGNFGFGVPIIGGLIGMATGGVKSGIGSMLGGVLGNMLLPGVGGVLGSAAGGLLGGMFGGGGGGPASFTGIDVNANLSQQGFAGQLFGTSKNSEDSFRWPTFIPGNLQETANAAVASAFSQMTALAQQIGLDPSRLTGVSANVSFHSASHDAAVITQDLVNNMGALTDQMAMALLPNLKNFAQAGETATQTLTRLAQVQDQLRQAEEQTTSSLTGMVRGLPAQLGITSLQQAQQQLSVSPYLSPTEQFANARQLLGQTYTSAIGGDLTAVQAFPQILQQALGIGRDVYASGPQFQELFVQGNRQLNDLLFKQQDLQRELLAEVPASIQQASQDQITELRKGFKSMTDQLSGIQTELRRIQQG